MNSDGSISEFRLAADPVDSLLRRESLQEGSGLSAHQNDILADARKTYQTNVIYETLSDVLRFPISS